MSESNEPSADADEQPTPEDGAAAARKGGLAVIVVIVLSLLWYLMADRFTPFTSQARIEGYVVGVAPKVAGLVTDVWVTNNQEVEEGQRLFQIDRSQYEIALAKARSDLENTRRQVEAGDAAVEAARASLRAAQANEVKAQKDLTRLQRLYEEDPGTISVRRLEISQASLDQATARVAAARADIRRAIEQMGGESEDDNALLKAARSAVDKAELDLANTVVTASSRGLITDLRADVGQYAGTGAPVMTLIAIHDLWINAEFTENNLGHVEAGTPVEIIFDSIPGAVFEGEVRSVGVGVSSGQSTPPGTLPTIQNSRDWLRQSQRFPVIVEFSVRQDADLSGNLRLGGQVSVIAYSEGHWFLRMLGKLYMRIMSWLSYAY